MVKTSDLNIPKSNLEQIPAKEKRKELNLQKAIRNLTRTPPPDRLKRTSLPDQLLNIRSG